MVTSLGQGDWLHAVMFQLPFCYIPLSLVVTKNLVMCLCAECALEDETYEDGAETQVECNRCVCACGNWVCTAMTCTGKNTQDAIYVFYSFDHFLLLTHWDKCPKNIDDDCYLCR